MVVSTSVKLTEIVAALLGDRIKQGSCRTLLLDAERLPDSLAKLSPFYPCPLLLVHRHPHSVGIHVADVELGRSQPEFGPLAGS